MNRSMSRNSWKKSKNRDEVCCPAIFKHRNHKRASGINRDGPITTRQLNNENWPESPSDLKNNYNVSDNALGFQKLQPHSFVKTHTQRSKLCLLISSSHEKSSASSPYRSRSPPSRPMSANRSVFSTGLTGRILCTCIWTAWHRCQFFRWLFFEPPKPAGSRQFPSLPWRDFISGAGKC